MTVTPQQFVAAARDYLGTPHHHQGRKKHVGVDCVGLVCCAASDVGIILNDFGPYSPRPDGHTLIERIEKNAVRVDSPREGDLAVFWIRSPALPTHVAILTDIGIIHSYEGVGWVVETALDARWRRRWHSTYRVVGG